MEKETVERSCGCFATKKEKESEAQYPEDELLQKIGQLNVENDFLRKKYSDYLLRNEKS